jgi:nicotinate-nucleotide adenylyltransferase
MTASLRIGLLGGSFNPAHAGHLHISREALRKLHLDRIWWLVSPQNPLKPAKGMAPYAERVASVKALIKNDPRMQISDFEARHHLHFTYATVKALKKRYPTIQFVWLMGSDNLAHFHRWQAWRNILREVPIAVFDRAPFSHRALHCKAALAIKSLRLKPSAIASLARRPGRWAYLLLRRHSASSTEIRAKRLANK